MQKFLRVLLLTLSLSNTWAQTVYTLSKDSISYQERTNGQQIFNNIAWSHAYAEEIPLGFSFPFLDTSFNSVFLEASGRLVFDADHHYWVDLNTIGWLRAAPDLDSSRVEVYRETTFDGKKLLLIQFSNARYVQDVDKRISFQLAIREGDSAISFHMGPRDNINPGDISLGPYLAYAHLTNLNTLNIANGRFWTSSNGILKDTIIRNSSSFNFLTYQLEGLWPENTLLTLYPGNKSLGLRSTTISQNYFSYNTQLLHLTAQVRSLNIYNLMGACVYRCTNPAQQLQLDFLPSGTYIAGIEATHGWSDIRITVK